MLEIDAMEGDLGPLDDGVERTRDLISSLELCHHKAARWVHNLVQAIGEGGSDKGLGTRQGREASPAEQVWSRACDVLSAWCAGCPAGSAEGVVASVPACRLVALIGERSPLKEWQVQRVVERIRSLIGWPAATDDPSAGFTWLLLDPGTDGLTYRLECPVRFAEHEPFWRDTACTIIRDTHDARPAPLSLAVAIDMLWPCHWDFLRNLELVLAAIGGDLDPSRPFATCGRNISMLPDRDHFRFVSTTLREYARGAWPGTGPQSELLSTLGAPSPAKRWLAASLDKTIRLQLEPQVELHTLFDLAGPEWIHRSEGDG